MHLLSRIGIKEKNANVELTRLCDNVYILTAHYNPISFLQEGSIIWVDRGECYEVLELNDSWNKEQEPMESFVSRMIEFVGLFV